MIRGFAAPKETSVSIRVIRESGKIENKGVVAYWHSNPLKRMVFRIKKFFRGN